MRTLIAVALMVLLASCGTLETKAAKVGGGDTKDLVLSVMGAPDDRQLRGEDEAWQYCQTGAGFGYHDHRVIWFRQGKVVGVNSYKSTRAGASCVADIKQIRWEDAPTSTIEIRNR